MIYPIQVCLTPRMWFYMKLYYQWYITCLVPFLIPISPMSHWLLLFFWKSCFNLRTSYTELIWCSNGQNAHNCTFYKRWSFIWVSLTYLTFNVFFFEKIPLLSILTTDSYSPCQPKTRKVFNKCPRGIWFTL